MRLRPSTASAALLVALVICACQSPRRPGPAAGPGPAPQLSLDLPLTRAPYAEVHANFKERLDQPYVYLEHRGSYLETMRALPKLAKAAADAGLELAGPPFGLYYDDPGVVAVGELRSRVCLPITAESFEKAPDAMLDILPQATVVYAYVAGAYPEVPRALPGLLGYMRSMRWRENGPVREVYLVQPGAGVADSNLVCELQVPVQGG